MKEQSNTTGSPVIYKCLYMSNTKKVVLDGIFLHIFKQGDVKVCVNSMITIQKVTSDVHSVPHQSPDVY
jgi:hypothetical protein